MALSLFKIPAFVYKHSQSEVLSAEFVEAIQLKVLFYIMGPSKYWLHWHNRMVKDIRCRAKKPKSEFQLLQLLAALRAM